MWWNSTPNILSAKECHSVQVDRRRKEVKSLPIYAFSLTTQMGAIIRTEINHGTQKLCRQVSFPERHLHQDAVQCQREITLRILENHCGVEPWFDQTQCPSFPAPILKTGICLLISFPFQFVFLSKGSLLAPHPWHLHSGLLVVLFSKPTRGSPFVSFVSTISLGNWNCATKM